MVFSKQRSAGLKSCIGSVDMEEPPANKSRLAASAEASNSSSASNPDVTGDWQRPVPEKSVLIVLIRGHVLRVGDRLSNNFDGDATELHTIFNSIKTATEKIENVKLVFLLGISAKNADSQTQAQVLDTVGRYVNLYGHRVSNIAAVSRADPDMRMGGTSSITDVTFLPEQIEQAVLVARRQRELNPDLDTLISVETVEVLSNGEQRRFRH
jgi:hypothetical protein